MVKKKSGRTMDEKGSGGERLNDEFRRMKRRQEVAELYLAGKSQVQISEQVKVSVNTVAKDLDEIRRVWVKKMTEAFDGRKAEELAKLDRLEQVAWEAYVRSCGKVVTTKTRYEKLRQAAQGRGARSGTSRMVPMREVTESTERNREEGDPRFLEQVSWCIETRLRVMGLLKGDTNNINQTFIDWTQMFMTKDRVPAKTEVIDSPPTLANPGAGKPAGLIGQQEVVDVTIPPQEGLAGGGLEDEIELRIRKEAKG